MKTKDTNASVKVPEQDSNEPLGDRGEGDKSWKPERGEQGISNRPDDEAAQEADDDDDDFAEDEDDDDDEEAEDDAEDEEAGKN